jgi:hypothetical protein
MIWIRVPAVSGLLSRPGTAVTGRPQASAAPSIPDAQEGFLKETTSGIQISTGFDTGTMSICI